MEAYLRNVLSDVEYNIDMIIEDELRAKIEDLAGTDNPRHRCHRDSQSPRYCRVGLIVFFVTAFGALKRELQSVALANHYETLIYGRLRASGMSHAMALRYCDIARMKERLNHHFVGFFNKLWEDHPEERLLGRTTIDVSMEVVSENDISGVTIVIDSDSDSGSDSDS